MITGKTLRLLRNFKGLKQKTVADKLNISQAAYSKLENKKFINGTVLVKIRTVLKCTDEEIESIAKLFTPPGK